MEIKPGNEVIVKGEKYRVTRVSKKDETVDLVPVNKFSDLKQIFENLFTIPVSELQKTTDD